MSGGKKGSGETIAQIDFLTIVPSVTTVAIVPEGRGADGKPKPKHGPPKTTAAERVVMHAFHPNIRLVGVAGASTVKDD
jgi:hypothetical protein